MKTNMRTVKYKNNGVWTDIDFMDLKTGMYFMLFEDDKNVVDSRKHKVFLAISDAYYNKDGVGAINIETTN